MSGYLQRLASAAMRPKETVRPLVGSIFSGRKSQQSPDDFSIDSQATPLDKSEMSELQGPPDLHSLPVMVRAQDEAAVPSLSETVSIKTGTENESRPAFAALKQTHYSPEAHPKKESSREDVTLPSAELNGTIYTPLIVNSPASHEGESKPDVLSGLASSSEHGRRTASLHGSEREPDEIQIHIGRIEVLAVPQAPAAAPVKVARTASSLDEYLKRRDRRGV